MICLITPSELTVAVQPNDVSLGFKTANAENTTRTTGNFQCIIDIKCIDLHIKVKGSAS
jgi:hypothetical protein